MSERGVREVAGSGVMVSFGERYLTSERFQSIYREGMELVEETARYLDGEGRNEGKSLKGASSLSYATESMRLTTRLMNIASWLLIRRSVNNGEMTQERARRERLKLKIDSIGRPSHIKGFDELPQKLRTLIEASFCLQDKVIKLDRLFEGGSVLSEDAQPHVAMPAPQDPLSQAIVAVAGEARPVQPKVRLVFNADRDVNTH
jgi:regulator of CtrA degradation